MAVITPQTDIYLLKVPLEISDMNQLTFSNQTAQYNYFNSLPKVQAGDYSYQRKDGNIRFEGHIDDIISYNYVMYRNDAYSDKWFYAFITDMQYISDNMTLITIKTDVWQTWGFDLTFKPCQVMREHTNDDTIGRHTLPENLELGDLVTNGNVVNFNPTVSPNTPSYYVIAEVAQVENTGEGQTLTYEWASGSHDLTPKINGLDRATVPLIVGAFAGKYTGRYSSLNSLVNLYDECGLGDAIVNVYVVPSVMVDNYNEIILYKRGTDPSTGNPVDGLGVPIERLTTTDMGTFNFSRPTSLDGYVPKNNRMFCYPFCYFNISNNAGTSLPYRYEDFSSTVSFKMDGCFGVSGNVKATPLNYKNISSSENGMDYSINGPKYPVLSWASDSYTNWLTQNSVNMETQLKTAAIATTVGAVAGGISGGASAVIDKAAKATVVRNVAAGTLVGGLSNSGDLFNTIREQHVAKTQANMVADQVKGNLGAGDYLWSKYHSPFTFMPMSVKAEYARCADEYFSMFGYATNRVKVPNLFGRRNWNYVKTIGCYIEGDIPQADMQEIKSMFDRGITLWHNPANFADYSANNDII